MPNIPITACIITYNEADRIEACIQSLDFCEEIIVIDSGSTDDTARLASELGAKITNFGVNQLGPAGYLEPESKNAVFDGNMEKGHLVNVSPQIYSGSSEIQRNIIAQRGLGLPRG